METWFLMEEDKLDEFTHENQGIETTEQYSRQAVIGPLMKAFNMTLQDVILYVFAAKISQQQLIQIKYRKLNKDEDIIR